MASITVPKLKFNEYLDQRIQERAGGKQEYKSIKKIWGEIRLRWTQAGYISGVAPSREQLSAMERELDEAVRHGKESEAEKNSSHFFKKKGTKERERAEAELRIGTWAIEVKKRTCPQKKPDMMGVLAGASDDVREGTINNHNTPPPTVTTPSAPLSLYPPLPQEEKTEVPPPYSQNPFAYLPHNPFKNPHHTSSHTGPGLHGAGRTAKREHDCGDSRRPPRL